MLLNYLKKRYESTTSNIGMSEKFLTVDEYYSVKENNDTVYHLPYLLKINKVTQEKRIKLYKKLEEVGIDFMRITTHKDEISPMLLFFYHENEFSSSVQLLPAIILKEILTLPSWEEIFLDEKLSSNLSLLPLESIARDLHLQSVHYKNKDWSAYVSVLPKQQAIYHLLRLIETEEITEALATVFISAYQRADSISIFSTINQETWKKISKVLKNNNQYQLPKVDNEWVTVYRGESKDSQMLDETNREQTLSWTLNKEIACFFASRFLNKGEKGGEIYEAKVKKEDILWYSDYESEVFIPSICLTEIKKNTL